MTSPDESAENKWPTGPDGVPVIVPPDADPTLPGADDPPKKSRRRALVIGTCLGLVIAIAIAVSTIRMPYYRFSPGTLYPTQPLITIDGAPTYHDDPGQIDFTTVASRKATIIEYYFAGLDPAVELIPAELIDGDKPPETTRQLNLEMMADSKERAAAAALRRLGYDVEVLGTGALVRATREGLPAETVLNKNDTIVEIDGQPIQLADEAVKAISVHQPGDEITLTIEPPPDQGEKRTAKVTLAARQDDATKALLGVDLGTRNTRFKLPIAIDVNTKDVGGPSAGLGMALGIIDVLTPGSLTGGKHVAVTGTIDPSGGVGPIGGIRQKTFLAERNGVDLFIVPFDELADAQQHAGGTMKVVGVKNLDEALQAIKDNGGSTDSLEQAAAGRTTGTIGS